MSKNEKNNKQNNEQNNRMNFFKKVYYSIIKISKYNEMTKIGLKDAIKYLFKLVAIVTIVLSIFLSYNMKKYINKVANYIDASLPEFTIEDNMLNLEEEEAVILDDDDVVKNLNCVVVINTLLEKEEAIKEYEDIIKDNNCMILIKGEAVFVTKGYISQESTDNIDSIDSIEADSKLTEEITTEESAESGVQILKYNELLARYNLKTENKFTKENLINSLKNNPITYYLIQYFIIYFIILFVSFSIEIVLIGVLVTVFIKLLKINLDSKSEAFVLSIYGFTLPIIFQLIFLVLGILFDFSIDSSIVQTIMVLIAFAYIVAILYKKRNDQKIKNM